MKKIIPLHEFQPINEAKEWPVGTIAKAIFNHEMGIKSNGWNTFSPARMQSEDDTLCYMKIVNSGAKWIEGYMIAPNCLTLGFDGYSRSRRGNQEIAFSVDKVKNYQIRINKAYMQKPTSEWKLIFDAIEADPELMGKSVFMDGSEAGIIDNEGKSTTIKESEYTVIGVNYELTKSMKTLILRLASKSSTNRVYFNLKNEDLASVGKALDQDQKEVISEWFARELGGAEIEVSGDKFRIRYWNISANKDNGFPNSFTAGPFVTEAQAALILKEINKLNKFSMFDASLAKTVRYSYVDLDIDDMIEWTKSVGIKTSMKELLALRKGAVTAKRFGI